MHGAVSNRRRRRSIWNSRPSASQLLIDAAAHLLMHGCREESSGIGQTCRRRQRWPAARQKARARVRARKYPLPASFASLGRSARGRHRRDFLNLKCHKRDANLVFSLTQSLGAATVHMDVCKCLSGCQAGCLFLIMGSFLIFRFRP